MRILGIFITLPIFRSQGYSTSTHICLQKMTILLVLWQTVPDFFFQKEVGMKQLDVDVTHHCLCYKHSLRNWYHSPQFTCKFKNITLLPKILVIRPYDFCFYLWSNRDRKWCIRVHEQSAWAECMSKCGPQNLEGVSVQKKTGTKIGKQNY